MLIVIATFVLAAVFVGYHASQEPRKELIDEHEEETENILNNNHLKQTAQTMSMKVPYNEFHHV